VPPVFDADVALVVRPDGSRATLDTRRGGASRRDATLADRALAGASGALTTALPEGCTSGVAAPLTADGQQLGTLVLGGADRRRPLREDQLPLLVPLASALAAALQGAAQSRRLVEATSRLQAVVDQSSDGIVVLDASGTVELWSPALEALTGVPAATAQGRPLAASLAVADGPPADAGSSLLTPTAPRATVELLVVRADGQQRTVRSAHAAVFDDDGLVREWCCSPT
jgi:PAS domain S-box-containing protein